ncbi:MAG: 1-acyl-sn-glycerol-3-phosphate acyltransferase [Treponema sp.]|jgi:glycerol-3-phosphate O-acyltransferase|nr:1-acyl-sn-glycerol-3-phosphate acyltransferase [Treponema sp.]
METLNSAFGGLIKKALVQFKTAPLITGNNVYQKADTRILPFVEEIVQTLILPESGIGGMDRLREILDRAREGKSCLLLLEHYSNLDLPCFRYLLTQEVDRGQELADALVAIAGIKLSEENPGVAALTSAYTRIVIYPSRSLKSLHGTDLDKKRLELLRAIAINRAAMKALNEVKRQGKLILVFPSGTRYRLWEPNSKRGVREIDSYIKSFDYMCMVAVNGECLHVREGDMTDDSVSRDIVRFSAGPVIPCAAFRATALAGAGEDEDRKQRTADAIMAQLEELHLAAESGRQELLQKMQLCA